MSELAYKAFASALAAVVLLGVGLTFYRGIRDGLRQNRLARKQKAQRQQLADQAAAAGQACAYIDPEQTGAVSADDGQPAAAFPFARPGSLPPLTAAEVELLQRVGLGCNVTRAPDAVRLRRLEQRFEKLLAITPAEADTGAFFFCRVRLWAWVQLAQPGAVPVCIDVERADDLQAA